MGDRLRICAAAGALPEGALVVALLFAGSGCFYTPQGSDPAATTTGHGTTAVEPSTAAETTAGAPPTSSESTATTTPLSTESSSTEPEPSCGDGVLDGDEECDDGNANDGDACTNACTLADCGDGVVGPGEQCDDGNGFDNDACTNACSEAICGDAIIGPGEQCDDANGFDGDACTNACGLAICGDGVVGPGEQCDDGNDIEVDDCLADCTLPSCGDGVIQNGEACDDGDDEPGDECSQSCASTVITAIAIGADTSCVLFDSGAVRCWGANLVGALGQGDVQSRGDVPGELPVPDILVGAAAVGLAVGYDHMCIWTEEGTVHCWGDNDFGQVGNGDNAGDLIGVGDQPGELPTAAVDVGGEVLQVVAGVDHTCALLTDHTVRCWGKASYGQLGTGSTESIGDGPGEMPPDPVAGLDDVKELVAGSEYNCAILLDGSVKCWGRNRYGQLGLGHTEDIGDEMTDIITATPIGGTAVQITAGYDFTCVRLVDNNIRCWGENFAGQCGRGDTMRIGDGPGEMPPLNINIGGSVTHLVSGTNHSCALLMGGNVRCWGWGKDGRLGTAGTASIGDNPNELPTVDLQLGGGVLSLSTHLSAHTCALVDAQPDPPVLRCWGDNDNGQLGLGHTDKIGDDEFPAVTSPIPY